LNDKTLEQRRVAAAVQQRLMRQADRIVDAEMQLALGMSLLFERPVRGGKFTIVEDPDRILAFLNGELDPDRFQCIVTERPLHLAADSLLSRAIGKPSESVDLKVSGQTTHIHEHFWTDNPAQAST